MESTLLDPKLPEPGPAWCPACFLTAPEQASVVSLAAWLPDGTQCQPGSCVILGWVWACGADGAPVRPLYPWVDDLREGNHDPVLE